MSDPSLGPKSNLQDDLYKNAYDRTLAFWDTPCNPRYLETAFGRTHILEWGKPDGEPLLLLHGAGDSSTMWYANARKFGEDHRMYAVDVIGDWNRSEIRKTADTSRFSNPEIVSLSRKELAVWIAEVIKTLGLNRPHVLGFSFGGFLAANFAVQEPKLLDKLILLAPAATLHPLSLAFFMQSLSAVLLRTRSRAKGFLRWQAASNGHANDAFNEQAVLTLTMGMPRLKMRPVVLSDAELAGIKNQTLLLIGDQEVIYDSSKAMSRAKRLMPNLEAALVPNCGHHIPTEQPRYLNERVLNFLMASSERRHEA